MLRKRNKEADRGPDKRAAKTPERKAAGTPDQREGKRALMRRAELAAGALLAFLLCVLAILVYRDRQEVSAQAKKQGAQSAGAQEEEDFITWNGKKYQYNKDIEVCLCMGIDKSEAIEEKVDGYEGLSDANMLVCVNKESGEVKILAIPRDTMVTVKVVDEDGGFVKTVRQQLTLQYAYGNSTKESCKLMAETVSNLLYRIPINRYCSINMEALPTINDAVGGVDVAALQDIELSGGTVFTGEQVHLEGADALTYVRYRDTAIDGSAMDRLARQSQYIAAYLERAGEAIRQDPGLVSDIFESLDDNVYSNLTADDLGKAAEAMAGSGSGSGSGNILTVPGEVVKGEKLEEFHVDEDQLKEMIIQTFYIEISEGQE